MPPVFNGNFPGVHPARRLALRSYEAFRIIVSLLDARVLSGGLAPTFILGNCWLNRT